MRNAFGSYVGLAANLSKLLPNAEKRTEIVEREERRVDSKEESVRAKYCRVFAITITHRREQNGNNIEEEQVPQEEECCRIIQYL